jgi:hypothetical protein
MYPMIMNRIAAGAKPEMTNASAARPSVAAAWILRNSATVSLRLALRHCQPEVGTSNLQLERLREAAPGDGAIDVRGHHVADRVASLYFIELESLDAVLPQPRVNLRRVRHHGALNPEDQCDDADEGENAEDRFHGSAP